MNERIAKDCLLAALAYNIVMTLSILITKKPVSTPHFLIGLAVCMVLAFIGSLPLVGFDKDDQNEEKSRAKLMEAFSHAVPLGITKTGASLNSSIGGLIMIRDTPEYHKVFTDVPFRELKVLVDDDCYIEGIGALSSIMPDHEMPDGLDIVMFLADATINEEEFLGYHTLESIKEKTGVQNDWHNVEIDGKPSAFLVRDAGNSHEFIGDCLKEWRRNQARG